jgi:hypothetical protein
MRINLKHLSNFERAGISAGQRGTVIARRIAVNAGDTKAYSRLTAAIKRAAKL